MPPPAFIPVTPPDEAPAPFHPTPWHVLREAHMLAVERLHGDDTTVLLLARGASKTVRLWAYVRYDRPFAGQAPPVVVFCFSQGEHPALHRKG